MEDPKLSAESPNGVCVRFSSLVGGKKLCQELQFFFGCGAMEEARAAWQQILADPEEMGPLSQGQYLLELHPAWRGNDVDPDDYDDTSVIDRTFFSITKTVHIEVIE